MHNQVNTMVEWYKSNNLNVMSILRQIHVIYEGFECIKAPSKIR